ncbi:DUF4835 family protein [Parasediminibacterium sp. JCM 36343]|uniref:type IX secretion system protein PorD n=1 Tax=Parasediminibacterium sp. JCM 36343 TaxID=3374279 RepID=UPI003977EBA8
MSKKIAISILSSLFCVLLHAQELQVKVTVNASRINSTVDKKVFVTLQNQLNNFMNNRKWTGDDFKQNEKISCSFLLNVESIVETNVYKGSLIIQAGRPVHSSSYQSALINLQDPDISFKYVEYQPIDFNESRVQGSDPMIGNLSAVFAYYAYTILGLDYDSYSPKGGDKYYQKALNIVNNAPESSNINGWKLFDGLRNRYWLNENLVNTKYSIVHDVFYSYYRSGLDKLYASDAEARKNILQSITQLQAFNNENANTAIVQFFMQSKTNELIGVFKKAAPDDKAKAVDILAKLDITNAQRYKDETK